MFYKYKKKYNDRSSKNKEFHTNGVTLSIKTGPKLLDVYHFVNEAISLAHHSH